MALEAIDFGSGPDTPSGDTLFAAFTKINANLVKLKGQKGPTNPNFAGVIGDFDLQAFRLTDGTGSILHWDEDAQVWI